MAGSPPADPAATLEMLERELMTYGPALAEKPRVVVDVYRGDKHVQEQFR